jgi:hypothetical protein
MSKSKNDYEDFYIRLGYTRSIDVTKKRMFASEATLEREAQKKLTGGYNKRNVLCNNCYELKASNGSCNCS